MSACSVGGPAPATDWSHVSSAADGGGLINLVKAAQREGSVNIPGPPHLLPDGLAGAFEARYGVHVNVVGPGIDSTELATPSLDTFDVGVDTAASNTSLFAPYLVFYWLEIPSSLKNPKAYWYQDCGGYSTIGYDPARARPVGSLSDLLLPEYRSKVALEGSPLEDTEGLSSVMMASLANGGSPESIGPGLDFFHRLVLNGSLAVYVDENPPVLIAWNGRLPAGYMAFVPSPTVSAYDVQAVNRNAPHPAAARLWEEFLFSDEGQNTCLRSSGFPSRMERMRSDGVLDVAAAATLGEPPADAVMLTPAQTSAARAYLGAHWTSATEAQ